MCRYGSAAACALVLYNWVVIVDRRVHRVRWVRPIQFAGSTGGGGHRVRRGVGVGSDGYARTDGTVGMRGERSGGAARCISR